MAIDDPAPIETSSPERIDLDLEVAEASDPLAPASATGLDDIEHEPTVTAAPVEATERVAAVDVLRGFALCGILAMNIVAFAWPFPAYDNPDLGVIGSVTANRVSWMVSHMIFSGKMMSLFSMLFGAGLVLMADRAETRGASIRRVYYRRVGWLIAFGLIHAYFIWSGDILFAYGVCGLVLFPFRHKMPKTLIALGVGLILFSTLTQFGFGLGMRWLRGEAERLTARQEAGETLKEGEEQLVKSWSEARAMFQPTPEQFAESVAIYRGSYAGIFPHRAQEVAGFQLFYLPIIGFWGIAGRMLLGMGLMKLGIFAASRSRPFYLWMAGLGYGVGLPLTLLGGLDIWANNFDPMESLTSGQILTYLGTVPVALGHAAVVMLLVQSGAIGRLQTRLAALGRMALTNYLAQSLICTTLFYGYGFGLFGRLDRPALWLVVFAVWALQLAWSLPWLTRFRFGPAEWLWRSLTYGRPQPIRYEV